MNTSINFCDGVSYPNKMIPTPASPADKTQLDALIVPDKDILNVFDRGYFNFIKFDVYCNNGIRFVTLMKINKIVNVIEDLPVEQVITITKTSIMKIRNINKKVESV